MERSKERDSESRHRQPREEPTRLAGKPSEASDRGARAPHYEDWSRDALYARAKEMGIEGRSKLDRRGLISALRAR